MCWALGNIVTVQHEELSADPTLVQDQLHQVKILLAVTGLVLCYGHVVGLLRVLPHVGHSDVFVTDLAGGQDSIPHIVAFSKIFYFIFMGFLMILQ